MYATVLRAGLWTMILVLALYIFVTANPNDSIAEMIPERMLQQALVVSVILIIAGILLRIFDKGARTVAKNRCRVCRTPIPSGAMYCRAHLREILHEEDDRTHATRTRR